MSPETLHCFTPDGASIGYCRLGHGPPLVLVPSWTTSIEQQFASTSSAPFYERLCRDRTLVMFDRRGVGASRPAVVSRALAGQPDDLTCVLDHLGTADVDLIGDNDGCYIVAAFAARHHARVRRIAWWCPLVGGKDARPDVMLEFAQLMRDDWDEACPQRAKYSLSQASEAEHQVLAGTLRDMTSPETAATYLEWEAAADSSTILPTIEAQSLVLCTRRAGARSMGVASLLPHARFEPMDAGPATGHLDFHDVADTIARFLGDG